MYEIKSLLIKTDVTFVKILHNIVVAGIGGHLHIFDRISRKLRKTLQVFEGQKIYGIVFNLQSTECLIYGANKIKIFTCNLSFDIFEEVKYHTCGDWILATKWLNKDKYIATVLMHNCITLWTKDMEVLNNVFCSEKCLLYSAHLINDTWENLIILSGTVFSEVLAWKPTDLSLTIYRLKGHKGVIFSIDYDASLGLICTTSDDRSAKLWSVTDKDIFTELQQPDPQIALKYSLYGHSARVFKCQILDQFVITAGEDSVVNIWNLEGTLFRKIDAHQGSPIWALDYDKENCVIVTGGGDCGLNLFGVKENVTKHELQIPGKEVCKRLAILNNDDLAIITEQGMLFYYSSVKAAWNEIAHHDGLKSYALLNVSSCKKFLAVAGYNGLLIIYQKIGDTLKLIYMHEIEGKSRIFSIHWLSPKNFLTCGVEGNLICWQLSEVGLSCINSYKLPMTKERWTTSAVILNEKYIVVGDRKGNIYLYSPGKLHPIQVIKKAHNHLGVTSLRFHQNILTTLGRNSIVKKYLFNEATETLTMMSSDKVSLTWLAAIYEHGNNEFILSFMGNEFIMWDYKNRRTLLKFDCGGGHRSWDFHFNGGYFNFAYIKDKIINTLQIELTSILPLSIIEGYHVNEINSAVFVQFKDTCRGIFISGGEDTTLRINRLEINSDLISFTNVNVLKAHLSSIRVATICKIDENFTMQKYLLFTGGGRDQIIMWELQVVFVGDADMDVLCRESCSYYEHDIGVSEVRVMDLCTVNCNSYIVLVSACSDGTLKVYLVVDQHDGYKLNLMRTIVYKLKCILKVFHILICNHNILITMATDGKISFWDFTLFFDSTVSEKQDVIPFACIETHQSGINSFSCRQLSETRYVFLTGGDDNAIIISLFNFSIYDGAVRVELLNRYCDISAHCAQITGAFIVDNYLLTTSIDQKLNVFKYKVDNNNIECNFVRKYNSSIPDIQGMECYKRSGSVFVFLFGKGVEICEIKELC